MKVVAPSIVKSAKDEPHHVVVEDKELIESLKNGNQRAFRILLERYQEMVITTCHHFLRNHDDAHDIAQEVFVEVFQSVEKFRQDAAISTWLYRISVNKSLNHLRKNKRRQLFSSLEKLFTGETFSKNLSEPDFTKPEEKEFEYQARAKILHKAIDALPTSQKTAFTLHKFNNLSYKEIADVMDVSLSAVESLIHRARKGLQSRLIKDLGQAGP